MGRKPRGIMHLHQDAEFCAVEDISGAEIATARVIAGGRAALRS